MPQRKYGMTPLQQEIGYLLFVMRIVCFSWMLKQVVDIVTAASEDWIDGVSLF